MKVHLLNQNLWKQLQTSQGFWQYLAKYLCHAYMEIRQMKKNLFSPSHLSGNLCIHNSNILRYFHFSWDIWMGSFTSTPTIPGTYTQVLPLLAARNQPLINEWNSLEIETWSAVSTRKHYASHSSSLWKCTSLINHADQKRYFGQITCLKVDANLLVSVELHGFTQRETWPFVQSWHWKTKCLWSHIWNQTCI